ncbi:GRAM domain protein [Ancylostoma ceylanicum]|uniref:GRAM domain protein n=1 Tax=Ancylostoma ceylanicum TaxID=53326 RepID=A0A0D6LKY1_9BILA|nr:GRAM domain protein [Ancylostoma ceylanicum]
MTFSHANSAVFKGTKTGSLYLTSHRIIFMNKSKTDALKSFSMPFQTLRDVKLEQPLLTPNYLKGGAQALPDGQYEGEVEWRLSFPKGGCVEFGQTLLHATEIASRMGPFNAPPPYTQCFPCVYYFAPAGCYMPPPGSFNGFQAPTDIFPEKPKAENVYMYEAPPPYAGIGQAPPVPAGNLQLAGKLAPTAPPPAYS